MIWYLQRNVIFSDVMLRRPGVGRCVPAVPSTLPHQLCGTGQQGSIVQCVSCVCCGRTNIKHCGCILSRHRVSRDQAEVAGPVTSSDQEPPQWQGTGGCAGPGEVCSRGHSVWSFCLNLMTLWARSGEHFVPELCWCQGECEARRRGAEAATLPQL